MSMLNILVVDDDRELGESLAELLELQGYRTEVAGDAKAALTLARTRKFEVALVEVRLECENGADFIYALSEACQGVDCILMSADADLDKAIKAVRYNAYDYLRKPFDDHDLIATLERCFEKRRLEREKRDLERRVAEVLVEGEAKFRKLAEDAMVGIHIHREFRSLFVNRAYANIFGYALPDEILARDSVVALIAPCDRDRLVGYSKQRLAGNQAPSHYEYQGVRKDGTLIWLESRVRVVDWEGELATQVTIIDITERKRAAERLQSAIESIPDGVVLFDADDRVVMWNQRFADHYPELEDLLQTRPTAEEMFRERIRNGAVGGFEVPIDEYVRWRMETRQKQKATSAVRRHSDGRWFRTTERKTSEGGIVSISTDITELKSREIDLRESAIQAEFANRSKSEFLANMSHELRTPLNAILGFSDMMSAELLGPLGAPEYRQYADDIHQSGAHLLSVIDDILDLSKIEAGKLELREAEVDVTQIVGDCRRFIEGHAKDAGLALETRMGGDLPRIWVDERLFKQVILNLLSNAVKFTPKGGRVTVDARVDEAGRFVLAVSDTGIGMAAENIPKALTPFSQVASDLARDHQGTGLGLPLVNSLVEAHGGTLELESKLGVGTSATIWFPAERVVDGGTGTTVDKVHVGAAQ